MTGRYDMVLRYTTAALLVIASLLLPASTWAANDYKLKPGADGELCLSCHEVFQQKLKLRHVHEPAAEGQCSECHNPHASKHGALLHTEPNLICQECHDDLLPDKTVSVHEVVADGLCTDCHDTHASKNRDLLVTPRKELCFDCHEGIEKSVRESAVVHEPATDGCLDCHDAHASAKAPSLLTVKEPDLCLDCHDSSQPNFSRSHLGYPVTSSTCSLCHDPHGSNKSAILKDNVHSPVAKRMCGQCHKGNAAPGKTPPAEGNIETCGECHKKTVEVALRSANSHWPALDQEGCLTCHDPHASKQPKLLSERELDLCGGCHPSVVTRQQHSKVKHEPVLDGDCNACHTPHGSDNPYLFEFETDIDVCAECHEFQRHSTHPIGNEVKDPRNTNATLDCSSCHRAHGTQYDHMFPFATYTFLCTQCHTGMRR